MPTGPKESQKPAAPPASRQERQAKALRDNLKKRKAQQRERQDGQRAQEHSRQARQGGRAAVEPDGGPDGGGQDGGGGDGS